MLESWSLLTHEVLDFGLLQEERMRILMKTQSNDA